jgi:hypothetical protein
MNKLKTTMASLQSRWTLIKIEADTLFLRAALWLGKIYWKSIPREIVEPSPRFGYDHQLASRRRLASGKLASMVPLLIGESAPCTLGGVPSWLMDFATDDRPFVPPVDVMFPRQQLMFSFAPAYPIPASRALLRATVRSHTLEQGYSSPVPGDDRNLLEDLFARRLNLSSDPFPIVPVFCSAEEVLSAQTLDTLALILNRAWQESLLWCLAQLPALPDVPEETLAGHVGTGDWVDRRIFLEEAVYSALFPLGNDVNTDVT